MFNIDMKRGLILIFALFLLVVSVNAAQIELGQNLKSQYNLGDTINLDGKITSEVARRDLFRLDIVCGDSSAPSTVKVLDLDSGQTYFFNEKVMVPAGSEGTCRIVARFGQDQASSNSFALTKDLKGTFEVSDPDVQLGDNLMISGRVLRLSDVNVEGIATVSIRSSNETFFVDTVDVKGGSFQYGYNAEKIPGGRYEIDVYSLDLFGNEKTFSNVLSFNVHDNLEIKAGFQKEDILPGESVIVNGDVRFNNGELVEQVKLKVNGVDVAVNKGLFTYKIDTMTNMKSGENPVILKVTDDYGNIGEGLISFKVIPIPTRLTLVTDKEEYLPNEYVEINAFLYDQADDKIDNQAKVVLRDSSGNPIQEGTASLIVKLDQFAKPGVWKINAQQDKFKVEDEFVVKPSINLTIWVEGQDIFVKNAGNVKFNDDLQVNVDDEVFVETISLELAETKKIELDKYEGLSNVDVLADNNVYKFGEVDILDRRNLLGKLGGGITGNVVSVNKGNSGETIGFIFMVVILGVFILGFYLYKKRTTSISTDLSREKERREASERLRQIRSNKEKNTVKKRIFFSKPIDEKAAKDFRESVLSRIKDESPKEEGYKSAKSRELRERYGVK